MSSRKKISCPDCKKGINVDELVYNQLESKIREEYNKKMNHEKYNLDRKAEELEKERQLFRLTQIQFEGEVDNSRIKMISDKMIII